MIFNYKAYNYEKMNNYLIDSGIIKYNPKVVFVYLENKNVSLIYEDFYINYNHGSMNIYKILEKGEKIHILNFDGNNFNLSELFNKSMTTYGSNEDREFCNNLCLISEIISVFTYFLLKDNFENNKRSSKNYKVISMSDSYKVKYKKIPVEIRIYNEFEGLCKYEIGNNVAKITLNNLHQTQKIVPSKLYPLVNNNFEVFTSENSYDLEDNRINELLSDITFMVGACYSNSDKILEILKANNINAKYYSGWLYRANQMTHHAWIVIDNKHLIDVSVLRKVDTMLNKYISSEKSISSKKADYIDKLYEIIQEEIPFKDKYYYGKASRNSFYIGCNTNSTEARKSYNDLIRSVPNHPDYQNIDKNGVNETQRALYKKLYNKDI